MLPDAAKILGKFELPQVFRSIRQTMKTPTEKSTVVGWVHKKPKQIGRGLTFARIRDVEGTTIQIVDNSPNSILRKLKPDSVICVDGLPKDNEIHVNSIKVLNEANIIPGQLMSEYTTTNWPGNYRYIQLRDPNNQNIIRKRAQIVSMCRRILEDKCHFVEVETPLLFKSTPEGAREFLVPTRRKGFMYALPQSPQQYKQLLIASGVDRYFQVAKCFRDEDLRQDRQPEFTQLDLEMAFASAPHVQEVVEQVVTAVWEAHGKTQLTTVGNADGGKLAKLTYDQCIANYGIDKPDLRLEQRIIRLPATATGHKEYPVLEAIVLPPNSDYDFQPVPRVKCVEYESENQLQQELSSVAEFDDWQAARSALGPLERGSKVIVSDRQELSYENPTPLGKIRQELCARATQRATEDPKSVGIWVHKFPLFEPLQTTVTAQGYPEYDYSSLKATHHPFTMVDLDDYHLLETDPLKCHGQHYDLVIDGVELGGGSTRIHDSELQRYILDNILKVPNSQQLFGHLIDALATGCPPHAGLAIGMDRFVAMLCGLSSVREVIAFPKTMTGTDPMMSSPSKVTAEQLKPYHIRVQ